MAKSTKTNRAPPNADKSDGNVWIELRTPAPGPTPVLTERKAPVVGADGREIAEEPEKSFFQKYWWIVLIGAIFALQGAGGDK